MYKVKKSYFGLLLGAAMLCSASAAEVVGIAPFTGSAFGQQSDASGPAHEQSFVAPTGTVLEAVRWWGFHGQNSLGPGFDNFVVLLDGVAQTGTLSVQSVAPGIFEYTLDVADTTLVASVLSIVNDSGDVEWFWQSAAAVGNPGAPDSDNVAFSLIGHQPAFGVAEPDALAILLPMLSALMLGSRRRQHQS